MMGWAIAHRIKLTLKSNIFLIIFGTIQYIWRRKTPWYLTINLIWPQKIYIWSLITYAYIYQAHKCQSQFRTIPLLTTRTGRGYLRQIQPIFLKIFYSFPKYNLLTKNGRDQEFIQIAKKKKKKKIMWSIYFWNPNCFLVDVAYGIPRDSCAQLPWLHFIVQIELGIRH